MLCPCTGRTLHIFRNGGNPMKVHTLQEGSSDHNSMLTLLGDSVAEAEATANCTATSDYALSSTR